MREAGVMVLTHETVSETSPLLLSAMPRPTSSSVQRRSSMSFDPRGGADAAAAALPLRVLAPPASHVPEAKAQDNGKLPSVSAASSTTSSGVKDATPAAPITSLIVAQQPSNSDASNLASGKLAQERLDAEADKQMLLANAAALASPDIQRLIADTEQRIAYLASQASQEIRRLALYEAISAMREQLARRLAIETEEREVIEAIQRECVLQLSRHEVQPRLSSDQRAQSRSSLFSYMSRLQSCLNDFKKADVPLSTKVPEVTRLVEAVSARAAELQGFESQVETKLNEIKAVKARLSANAVPADDVVPLSVKYHIYLTREETPEIREEMTAVLGLCEELERAEIEAVAFVQAGSNLQKYARDKLVKKSKHDPVSSLVKIASGNTLVWGAHKVGPKIIDLSPGPSQLLLESGILGQR